MSRTVSLLNNGEWYPERGIRQHSRIQGPTARNATVVNASDIPTYRLIKHPQDLCTRGSDIPDSSKVRFGRDVGDEGRGVGEIEAQKPVIEGRGAGRNPFSAKFLDSTILVDVGCYSVCS